MDSKIINADQKAQILKKPSLQESARSIEEQISQFEDYVKYYNGKQEKLVSEIDALKAAHEAELAAQVASAREAAREEAVASTREESEKEFSERLLTFSRFLAAVAHRRTKEDLSTPISKAFEAVLIQVFHGTEAAVADATKLIQGSKENIHMADGEALDVTCELDSFAHNSSRMNSLLIQTPNRRSNQRALGSAGSRDCVCYTGS